MKNLGFAVFLIFGIAQAKVGFHCYSVPGTFVQAYEYGSSNCGDVDSAEMAKAVGKDGAKDLLCMYSALCKPSEGDDVGAEPPEKNVQQLMMGVRDGYLKPAVVLCKGHGTVLQGVVNEYTCPTVSQCQRDIFYNISATSVAPPIPKGFATPAQRERGTR